MKHKLLAALWFILPIAALMTILGVQNKGVNLYVAIIAIALGAIVGVFLNLFFRWRKPLGGVTALLLVSSICAALFALAALISPVCPTGDFPARCPGYVIGTVSLSGALAPLAVGAMALPFLLIYRLVKLIVRWFKAGRPVSEKVAKFVPFLKSTPKPITPQRATEERIKPARDTTGKKLGPTPKQTKPKKRSRGRN